jgi:hypothetical protein
MRFVARALLAGGLGFAAALLVAACGGGSGLLSGDQANTLNSQLDQINSAIGAHNCGAAASASQNFGNSVANLPQTVNTTLRANLSQGASTVSNLASKDCSTNTTPTTPTATTATTATATTATTTQSTATTTTTHPNPPPTTTTTTSTTTSTSSGGGGLSGGGNSGGGGSGQGNGGSSGGAGAGGGQ